MSNLLDKSSIVLTPTAYDNSKVLCVKPSDGSGDFDFSRNSAATRVNAQGLVEDVQIISGNKVINGDFSEQGSELVTNGDFATDTNWSKVNSTISGGKGNLDSLGGTSLLFQSALVVGKNYKATLDVSNYNGLGTCALINSNGSVQFEITSNGNKEFYFTHGGTSTNLSFRAISGGAFSIDNVSVVEVGQNWTIENTWTIGDGVANGNGASGSGEELKQSGVLISGRTYSATYEVKNYVSGTVRTERPLGSIRSANGVYTEILTAQTLIKFRGNNFNGSITNVVFKEITNDTNLPRINYDGFSFDGSGNIIPDSGCGSWLFEPQSTNLIPYSEDFSNSGWTKNNTTVTSGFASPDGTNNAYKMTDDASNNRHGVYDIDLLSQDGNIYTRSCFVKKGTARYVVLSSRFISTSSGTSWIYDFDVNNWVLIGSTGIGQSIEDYGNGWVRLSISHISNSNFNNDFSIGISSGATIADTSYIGSGDTLFIYGAQVEQQSYSTSYIPTDGSQNTRNQDLCTNGGSVSTISSTSGVLYAEIAALVEVDNARRFITLNDGSASNGVVLRYEATGVINARYQIGGVAQCSISFATTITNTHKVAFKYAENDFALWVDGVEVGIDDVGSVLGSNTINSIDFDHGGGAFPFFGKTKCLAVWKEALTDTELQELTTI